MVTCELDCEISGEVLGLKLPAWQALLLHRVLPSCGGLLVYITLICFDFALFIEDLKNGEVGLATLNIILMTLPALISLVFTLGSPPPGLQTENTAFTVSWNKGDLRWLLIQLVNFLFFPVAAIGRYCYLVFWWVEAVFASYDIDKPRTLDAISRARAPSPIELYLFLQAFIHAAPHVVVNILIMMTNFANPDFEKMTLQGVSIIVSCMRMASTATEYRRFEREKLSGRKYPWSELKSDTKDEKSALQEDETVESQEEPIYESINKNVVFADQISQTNSDLIRFSSKLETDIAPLRLNSELIQFSPPENSRPFFEDANSDTSSEYIPPKPRFKKNSQTSSGFNSDDEYVRPISIIDRVAPRRTDMGYTIEEVNVAPPLTYAPRPGSLAVWAEKMVENAESIPAWLSAPPRRRRHEEVVKDEPDIPRRIPRSFMRGLEPPDAVAALVHYLGWYTFFVARLLSIAAFIDFFPFVAIVILFSHYQIMLLFLIVPQASTIRRSFYIFLAFIYLFCLMEFKVRFRHVRVWHVFWCLVCVVETIVFTGLWASISNNLGDWWKLFAVKIIFVNLLSSLMCFIVYFVLLKPRETIVFIDNKKLRRKLTYS